MKKLFSKLKLDKGYAIVELMIYMTLLSILTVVMVELFVSSLNVQLDSQSTSSVQQDSRYIVSRFMYDIQNANSVVIPTSLGATGSTLNLLVGGSNYVYSLNGKNLQITINGGFDVLNSVDTSVSNLSFLRLGNGGATKDSVQIKFTITSNTLRNQGPEQRNFQTTVTLR